MNISQIKLARIAAGHSQYDAAKVIGVSPSLFQKMEVGQATLKPEHLAKLAAAWKTSPGKLTTAKVEPSKDDYHYDGARAHLGAHKFWVGQIAELKAQRAVIGIEAANLRHSASKVEQKHRDKLLVKIGDIDGEIGKAREMVTMYRGLVEKDSEEELRMVRGCQLDATYEREILANLAAVRTETEKALK